MRLRDVIICWNDPVQMEYSYNNAIGFPGRDIYVVPHEVYQFFKPTIFKLPGRSITNQGLDFEQTRGAVLQLALDLILRCRLNPEAVHSALSEIREYRLAVSCGAPRPTHLYREYQTQWQDWSTYARTCKD